MIERVVKRYSAYFRGWCQAFGEHEGLSDHERGIHWLLTGQQAGFVLPSDLSRQLNRAVLMQQSAPPLVFNENLVEAGDFRFELTPGNESAIRSAIERILRNPGELHVYLTSHLLYGTRARIITLSCKKPIAIIYKEIGELPIRMD